MQSATYLTSYMNDTTNNIFAENSYKHASCVFVIKIKKLTWMWSKTSGRVDTNHHL